MKKSSIKKLVFVLCLLVFTSSASAANCKIKASYSNLPFSSKVVGSERYTIPHNSTSTILRKHVRVIKNYGSHDISVKYWSASGNHWKKIKKGKTRKVSGDLKKVRCLNTPKIKIPKPKMKFKGNGVWRNKSTSRPKGVYERVIVTKATCKNLCLRSSACTGIEYTTIFATPKKSVCELHTDKFHRLGVNTDKRMHAAVWLKK